MHIFFINEVANLGTISATPFHCENLNIRRLTLTVNSKEYTVNSDFVNGQVGEAYNELVRNLAVYNRGFALDLVNFQASNTFWVFDVTNGRTAGCK